MNKNIWFFVGLCLIAVSPSFGGTESHSAEVDEDQYNPWFLGEAAIPYCIEFTSPNASPEIQQSAKKIVASGMSKWKAFFVKYGFNGVKWGDSDRLRFKDEIPRGLSLDSKYLEKCTDPANQLKIVFVAQKKDWPFSNATAGRSVPVTPYDHEDFRTGGTVWIRIDTLPSEEFLEHLVLHELGHVFGMKHNSVFVMDENVVDASYDTSASFHLGNIESVYWKYKLKSEDILRLSYSSGTLHPATLPNWRVPLPDSFLKGLGERSQNFMDQDDAMLAGYYWTTLTFKGLKDKKKVFSLGIHDGRDEWGEFKEKLPEGKDQVNYFEGIFDDATGSVAPEDTTAYFSDKPLIGPSFFTTWYFNNDAGKLISKGKDRQVYLEQILREKGASQYLSSIPAYGSFTIEGVSYPAVIANSPRRGAILKLFNPATKEWLFFSGVDVRTGGSNRWDW